MSQRIDLYSVLKYYAHKINSPLIEASKFLDFIEKYAQRAVIGNPEWAIWTSNASTRFGTALPGLIEQGKCVATGAGSAMQVFLPFYYADLIEDSYNTRNNTAELPFPSEESLHIKIPSNEVITIRPESDFLEYLEDPPESVVPVIRIRFSDERYGSALAISTLLPQKLLEVSLSKISQYLNSPADRDYVQHKLILQFQGRETVLKDILNELISRPAECITTFESGGDFVNLFWLYFCSLIRVDTKKKGELLMRDIAVIQAVSLIEQYNSFYKSKMTKSKERELALKSLDMNLEATPYLFSLGDILKFTNNQGKLLINLYSKADLDAHLKAKTIDDVKQEGSDLLVLYGSGSDQWFVLKSKLLSLCSRLLAETRPLVKKNITKRWAKLLNDFEHEPAMENDGDFERLLIRITRELAPALSALLADKRFALIYSELERNQESIPDTARLFINGQLISMTSLLLFKRKDLLSEIYDGLPFYYAVPFFFRIVAYFHNLTNKKARKKEPAIQKSKEAHKIPGNDLQISLKAIEAKLVPEGSTLELSLADLQRRWSKLLDATARKNLVEDVNSLVRDRLRRVTRMKSIKITDEILDQMSQDIVMQNSALSRLHEQDALQRYIKLYMVDQLTTFAATHNT